MSRRTFHLIPHTHWDREWYLTRAGFQARLIPAIGALIDLLDDDPAARFVLDGQTVLAEDAVAVHPEWRGALARAAQRGQLDLGPWYILADELIPSGESLIRNLLLGSRDAAHFGRRMDVLYSPDAFGHPAALPALAAHFGIRYGVAWRGLAPNERDRDLYTWQAPDGSSILLYHLPANGYEMGVDLLEPGDILDRWQQVRNAAVARAASSEIAIMVGADHHAPPHNLDTLRQRVAALEPDNDVRVSTLTEFFAAVDSAATAVQTIRGELRWSYGYTWTLQGVHSTRARLKRHHDRAELALLRHAEPLAALAAWRSLLDHRSLLRVAARALMESQFHDTLCGCASDAVVREQGVRLESVLATAAEARRTSLHTLIGHDPDAARNAPARITPALVLWNPVARPRHGVVTASLTFFRRDVLVGPPGGRTPRTGPGFAPFHLIGADGVPIPVQVLGVRQTTERIDAAHHYPDQDQVDRVDVALPVDVIRGLALKTLVPSGGDAAWHGQAVTTTADTLSNAQVTVTLSPRGVLHITDRRTGEVFADLGAMIDEVDRGDSYSPCIDAGSRTAAVRPQSTAVLAAGPLFGALEARWVMPVASGSIASRMVVMLHADSPIVRLRYELDHHATDHRLRLRLPVGAGDLAVAGAAFGAEVRGTPQWQAGEFPAEEPVATAPAQRFVAAGAGRRGLAVLVPGFAEYEWTADQELFVTLLRATGQLSRGDLRTRPGHAGWPMAIPDAQEPGRHVIEFGVVPLASPDEATVAALEAAWEDTFLPVSATFVRDNVAPAPAAETPAFELGGSGLVLTAVKPAEAGEGLILRCYNTRSERVMGEWRIADGALRAALLRADESVMEQITIVDETRVPFVAAPHALVTVLLVPQRPASA
ncbi:MAG TPA: glycosyl hydrolase-related protein [Gemmatimonadales bacterium]|nr:glycosyl hydrolase-related protein [Gemmatimonadales bacterium]